MKKDKESRSRSAITRNFGKGETGNSFETQRGRSFRTVLAMMGIGEIIQDSGAITRKKRC